MTSELNIVSNNAGNGSTWLSQGFQLFKASPGAWIGTTLLYMLISICVNMVPFLGAVIGTVLAAFLTGGLMLGCNAQTQGLPFKVDYLFSAFSRQYLALARLGLIYLGLLVIAILPIIILGAFVDTENLTVQQIPVFMVLVLLCIALAIPVAMGYWLAPALIVCRGLDAWPAFVLSFHGCLKNILPALIFGLLTFFWTIVATLPLLLGWLILIPTLIAANFAAYQNIFKTEHNLV